MGYLLKEALKTLCGVNQWAYAVLWKIGHQNPRLLIWEECYYESTSFSTLSAISGNEDPQIAFQNVLWESNNTCKFQSSVQSGDKVHLLVKKMMTDNHVSILGEGLVGRVAFTGNHQWILAENYFGDAHLPEVLKDVCLQFSANMKTVAVIPILPYGVVQFGSHLTIPENIGFVKDVMTLLLQLGEVPGILLSDHYASNECAPTIGVPTCIENSASGVASLDSNMINSYSHIAHGSYHPMSSVQTSVLENQTLYSLEREIQNNIQSAVATFQAADPSPSHFESHIYHQERLANFSFPSANQAINGVIKAEVIPSNSIMCSALGLPSGGSSSLKPGSMRCREQPGKFFQRPFCSANVPERILRSHVRTSPSLVSSSNGCSVSLDDLRKEPPQDMRGLSGTCLINTGKTAFNDLKNVNLPKVESSFTNSLGDLTTNSSDARHMERRPAQSEFYSRDDGIKCYTTQAHEAPLFQHDEQHLNVASFVPSFVEDDRKNILRGQSHSPCVQAQSGNDLFDVLGVDFKNKLLRSCWSSCLKNKSSQYSYNTDTNSLPSKKELASPEILTTSEGIFPTSTDHLLDAVVSNVHSTANESMDDTVSCKTTLTNATSPSGPSFSLPCNLLGVSDRMKGELFSIPKYPSKLGAGSCSLETGFSRDSGTCTQSSSIYGPQLTSWIGKDHDAKLNNSASIGCSKKPDESSKPNRKRLKPGESPRPRPKDRQMIQDRVKELREIVPNGAKCSIDALLERTIKHMLFLQSVTKHADKLKQTGQSKIISNDGSLLLKENFEGGATWAYELGSRSMVCPIIVEDLNQPRQMLVEMLIEERGLFLEIADIIRGLGLSILKGIMETRNDKIWVRFTVEANRDVTRMEIFISLVRLLEQSSKTCAPQANNISNGIQQFHLATPPPPLPVTGATHNFH